MSSVSDSKNNLSIENEWAWVTTAPQEIRKIRRELLSLGLSNLRCLGPMYFETAFLLTETDFRATILMNTLRKAYDGDLLWSVNKNSIDEVFYKCAWVCHHWGFESNPKIVRGDCSKEENISFWKIVVAGVSELMSDLQKTKKGLEDVLKENESALTWEEVIADSFEKVRCNKECSGKFRITIAHVRNLETLHNNGMTNTALMETLYFGVEKIMDDLGPPKDYLEDESQAKCSEILDKGEQILRTIYDYLELMEQNNNFEHKKTTFAVFHSKGVLSLMKIILQMQRDFMAEVTAQGDSLKKSKYFRRTKTNNY